MLLHWPDPCGPWDPLGPARYSYSGALGPRIAASRFSLSCSPSRSRLFPLPLSTSIRVSLSPAAPSPSFPLPLPLSSPVSFWLSLSPPPRLPLPVSLSPPPPRLPLPVSLSPPPLAEVARRGADEPAAERTAPHPVHATPPHPRTWATLRASPTHRRPRRWRVAAPTSRLSSLARACCARAAGQAQNFRSVAYVKLLLAQSSMRGMKFVPLGGGLKSVRT